MPYEACNRMKQPRWQHCYLVLIVSRNSYSYLTYSFILNFLINLPFEFPVYILSTVWNVGTELTSCDMTTEA